MSKKTDSQHTIQMSRLLNHKKIHIELSSKCTLKCPRCPRTEMDPEGLNKDIGIDVFKSAFSVPLLSSIDDLLFCGDIGDPIYARDFLPIIDYVKQTSNVRVTIITNGSYKDPDWWAQLGRMLAPDDTVVFSVDGWDQASTEQYRVNSNFASIVAGARALRANSACRMTWSAIYFSFNESHISKIRDVAKDIGFDVFRTIRSSKFDGRYLVNGLDSLKPSSHLYVSSDTQYKETDEYLSNKPPKQLIAYESPHNHTWARCMRWQKEMFINVQGLVFPCPWFNNAYMENDFVDQHRDQININNRTLLEILDDPLWQDLLNRFDANPLDICKYKCRDCV